MVLLIYGGTNYYIYRRVVQAAQLSGNWSITLKFALLFVIVAFPVSHMINGIKPLTPVVWIGAVWLAVMAYAVLIFALIDLVRITDLIFGWFPNWLTGNPVLTGQRLLLGGTAIMAVLMIIGGIIAANPVVKNFNLSIKGLPENSNGYKVVLFSDTHLGVIRNEKFLNKVVDLANRQNADLVLIPGDVFDEPPRRLPWVADVLSRLRAKDGVVVSMGNHEYYSGEGEAIKVFRDAGLIFLRDQAFEIPGVAVVAGMDDVTGSRQYGAKPVPLKSYLEDFDPNLPLFVLHHTPVRRDEAREAGADLMVSGHTHGGQQWPFDYLTRMIFGVKRGLTKFGDMNFFLTIGAGTWGPPIRLGATPEIVVFSLNQETDVMDN